MVNSILLVTISAYLQRIVPITITWASLFLLLGRLGILPAIAKPTTSTGGCWTPGATCGWSGRLCFGTFRDDADRELAWWALAILASLCAVALVALVHRVRAVDVVE